MPNRGFTDWDTDAVAVMVAERLRVRKLHGHLKWSLYVKMAIRYVLLGEGELPQPQPISTYVALKDKKLAEQSIHVVWECLEHYLDTYDSRTTPTMRQRLDELPRSANDPNMD
jgi:hypothetical protein